MWAAYSLLILNVFIAGSVSGDYDVERVIDRLGLYSTRSTSVFNQTAMDNARKTLQGQKLRNTNLAAKEDVGQAMWMASRVDPNSTEATLAALICVQCEIAKYYRYSKFLSPNEKSQKLPEEWSSMSDIEREFLISYVADEETSQRAISKNLFTLNDIAVLYNERMPMWCPDNCRLLRTKQYHPESSSQPSLPNTAGYHPNSSSQPSLPNAAGYHPDSSSQPSLPNAAGYYPDSSSQPSLPSVPNAAGDGRRIVPPMMKASPHKLNFIASMPISKIMRMFFKGINLAKIKDLKLCACGQEVGKPNGCYCGSTHKMYQFEFIETV